MQLIIEAAEQAAAGIIDDAEAQAKAYLEESRQRADRVAEQRAREMWGVTDDLIARAETIRQQSDELLRALDGARRAMDEALRAGPAGLAPPAAPPPPQMPPAAQPTPIQQVPPPPPPAPPVGVQPPPAPPYAPQPYEAPSPVQLHEPPPAPGQWQPQAPVQPPPAPAPIQPPPAPLAPPVRDAGQPSEGARVLATQMAVAGSSRVEIEGRLQHEFGIREAKQILDAILGPER
ncbi:MAG: hypothetical protein WD827_05385 [Solirubrobacterales bacterium]